MIKILSASSAAVVALCALSAPAHAQSYKLAIPAQPLDRTLQAIGLTVHAEIIFPPELVTGKQAPAIEGNFAVRDALTRALANSGLTFRPAGSGYVVVARPQPEPTPTPPPPPAPDIASAPAESAIAAADIVVTGSRVAQNGFRAPSPTAVLTSEVIDRQGATSLQSILNQSPAFKATRSPGGNSISTVSPGMATADLRGLGGQRTLVLVNGSRIVPEAPSTNLGVPVATDLNLIPTLMIDRVETVTGGASAQYGSDAVSGVVNILLKRKMEGLQLTAQAGMSQRSDNKTYRIGLVTGTSFADGRGNIVFSAERDKMNGVDDLYSRDWGREEYNLVSNPNRATNGLPAFVVAPNVHNALGSAGVFLTAVRPTGAAGTGFRDAGGNSLLGTTVNPDGTLRPFDGGSLSNGTLQIGGEGASAIKGAALLPVIGRNTVYGRIQYEVSPSLLINLEGGYAESKAILDGSLPRFVGVTIARDNAYLPAQIKAALALPANANITGFTFNRIGYDIGVNKFTVYNKTPHGMIGLEGDLGGSWKWDGHYSYGRNKYIQITTKQSITANINRALAAVAGPGGAIVCADTLSTNATVRNAAAGCIPINLFGEGKPSDQAIRYITGDGYNTSVYGQHAAAANLQGDLFSTWAGPVSSAIGVEYRRENQTVKVDAIGAAQGFTSGGNASPFGPAHFDVKEAYFETIVPIARESFLYSADLNGAIRYADYSTVGGQTTWKVGAVIEPIQGLRFRGTRSRDIRAPALYELFSPGADVSNNITVLNPVTKASQNPRLPQNTTRGNTNLNAEKADSFTFGVVAEPRGALRGLRLSLDYYDINIKGAITNLSGANIATLCSQEINAGTPGRFCSFFTFNAAGVATRLDSPTLNLGSFHNIGIDGSLSYTSDLNGIGIGGRGTIALDGTYVRHAYVNTGVPGSAAIDRAGENGAANLGAVPRFRGNMSLTYAASNWSLTNQFLYLSKGTNDNTYNTAPTLTINDNSVPAVVYWNLYGTLTINKTFELFGRVDNMLDKDPPVVPYSVLNQPTNGQYYDKIGRSFNLGIRVKL